LVTRKETAMSKILLLPAAFLPLGRAACNPYTPADRSAAGVSITPMPLSD
jgi:hypothetical protein